MCEVLRQRDLFLESHDVWPDLAKNSFCGATFKFNFALLRCPSSSVSGSTIFYSLSSDTSSPCSRVRYRITLFYFLRPYIPLPQLTATPTSSEPVPPFVHHKHLSISEVSALLTDPSSSEDNTYLKPCIELFTSEHGKITLAAFTLPASAFPCQSRLFPRFVSGGVSNSLILRVSSEE
jgi:hypothetical protein